MRRLLAWLLPLLLVGGVAGTVYVLEVDEVRVTGLELLSPRAVAEASGLRPGDRILWVRLTAAERRVESIPAVAEATAQRRLPGTVVIDVREREPLVHLEGRPQVVADETGRLFEATPGHLVPTLAGWQGPGQPGEVLDRISRMVLEGYARFGDDWRRLARRIELRPSLTIWLADGTQVRFGSPDQLESKAAAAMAVFRATGAGQLAYIDVRSPSVPVSAPRGLEDPVEEDPADPEPETGLSPAQTPSDQG